MWIRVKAGHKPHTVGVESYPAGVPFELDVEEIPPHLAFKLEEVPDEEVPEAEEVDEPVNPIAVLQNAVMELTEPNYGQNLRGLVRFGGTAEAGITITLTATIIDEPGSDDEEEVERSLVYQEADTAAPATGVWTNGASAATSATSFAAAVNGDLRTEPPEDPTEEEPDFVFGCPVRALVLADGVTVLLYYCHRTDATQERVDYSTGDIVVTTSSPANVTVEDMTGGERQDPCHSCLRRHIVTALDVLADQIVVPLPSKSEYAAILPWMGSDGSTLATQPTGLLTTAETPDRLVYTFAGATDPAEGNVMNVLVHGGA